MSFLADAEVYFRTEVKSPTAQPSTAFASRLTFTADPPTLFKAPQVSVSACLRASHCHESRHKLPKECSLATSNLHQNPTSRSGCSARTDLNRLRWKSPRPWLQDFMPMGPRHFVGANAKRPEVKNPDPKSETLQKCRNPEGVGLSGPRCLNSEPGA